MNTAINLMTVESLALYVSELISKESGNVLGEDQQSMVISRLKKRMLDLGNIDHNEYYNYIQENFEIEMSHLISLLTTHHTFFFREFYHFEYLLTELPNIINKVKARDEKVIQIYCAACSKGQEVYSLAMFLDKYLKDIAPEMSFRIFGSDIDPRCVKTAQNGVYPYAEIKKVPNHFLKGNWQRGTGKIAEFVRIKPHLKEKCFFDVENLFELKSKQKYDIIFCRNVFIYFNIPDITKVVKSFKRILHDDGFFITGLCESLKNLDIEEFYTLGTSIYSFTNPEKDLGEVKETKAQVLKPIAALPKIPKPIKLLVVDDSKSVQKLLEKIFVNDSDFEVVGFANDGIEAEEFIKNNDVDAMTLDIHMPNKDGVNYLKDNFKKDHPKVVVVSSASRDDLKYAQKTLEYGASDFVEKPALNNLAKKSEEIKSKIKMSFFNTDIKTRNDVDVEFSKDYIITKMSEKTRIIVCNYSSLPKVNNYLKEFDGNQPPSFILVEGNSQMLDLIKEEVSVSSKYKLESLEETREDYLNNSIYISDLDRFFDENSNALKRKVSVCVFGTCSDKASEKIMGISDLHLLIEDLGEVKYELTEVAHDSFPTTSFYHISTEHLSKEK